MYQFLHLFLTIWSLFPAIYVILAIFSHFSKKIFFHKSKKVSPKNASQNILTSECSSEAFFFFFFFCSKFWLGQLPGSCVFYSQNLSKKLGVKIYEFGQSFRSHWTIFRKYVFEQKKIFFFTQNFTTGRFSGILQIIWENLGLKNIFFGDVFVNFEQQKQLL